MWNTYVPQNAKRCFFKSNELTEFLEFQGIQRRHHSINRKKVSILQGDFSID